MTKISCYLPYIGKEEIEKTVKVLQSTEIEIIS